MTPSRPSKAIIAEIDKRLTEQINQILHHEDYQRLEGAWRGLHHLVSNTETDEMLKIRVLNISKKDLHKTLKKFKGTAWDQSPIFKKIYEEEYGQFGGAPYGCLVGDYPFDHSPPDVELLGEIAKVSAAAHAPFMAGRVAHAVPDGILAGAFQSPRSDQDLPDAGIRRLAVAPRGGRFALHRAGDASFSGARFPTAAKTNPVEEFAFEEDVEGAEHDRYCWANAAYAMALNINESFKYYGWCSRIRGIESGGAVTGLPTHTFPTDDGGVDMKCPTEIAISDRREAELAKNGFMPLIHKKNSDFAAFIGAQSLHKPEEYDDPDATANANLAARFPYLFSTCRFAHYLKCIVRDKIGSFKERDDMQKWLNSWISNYVESNPATASEEAKARRPLASAEVVVEEVEGNPGYYSSKIFLRPHYQLEGLTVSLRLVSKLPSAKGG